MRTDVQATNKTRNRYQRIAPVYDAMETLAERRYRSWRRQFWSQVRGPEVLEVGVGTGKNMPYYPSGVQVTAFDLTPGMLARARQRETAADVHLDLLLGDAQQLPFADNAFDEVLATFVFCSVPDPVLGLQELARVTRQGGRLLLLEHMRAANPVLGALMDVLNPVVRLMGPDINRRTIENVQLSNWHLQHVEELDATGIFKRIVAVKEEYG